LVYVDACEIHLHPRLAKVWQKRGRPLRVPAAGADHKFAVFGALDYATGEVCSRLSLHKNSEASVGLLEQLRHTWPDETLVVVLAKVGYQKSRHTLAWWQCWQHRIGPFFPPPYTPELNLMERVWRHVKEKLSRHRWWPDWRAPWEATAALLAHLQAPFLRGEGPAIELVQNFCAPTELDFLHARGCAVCEPPAGLAGRIGV
jgi:DDE superfamily endonuclease